MNDDDSIEDIGVVSENLDVMFEILVLCHLTKSKKINQN